MQLKYRITEADVVEMFRLQSGGAMGFLRIIGTLMLVAGIYSLATRPKDIIPGVALIAIGSLLAFGMSLFVRRAYRVDKKLQQEISASISDEGVEFANDASRTEHEWRAFIGLAETKNLFLLCQTKQCMTILPKRAFSPGEDEVFRTLVAQKVPPMPKPKAQSVKWFILWLVIAIAAGVLWHIVKHAH